MDRQKYIYTKGCVGQFEKWLQDNLIFVAGIFVGIALLQVGLFTFVAIIPVCSLDAYQRCLIFCHHWHLVVTAGNINNPLQYCSLLCFQYSALIFCNHLLTQCTVSFPLQIFGICLAQNLVSDVKAVKANW